MPNQGFVAVAQVFIICPTAFASWVKLRSDARASVLSSGSSAIRSTWEVLRWWQEVREIFLGEMIPKQTGLGKIWNRWRDNEKAPYFSRRLQFLRKACVFLTKVKMSRVHPFFLQQRKKWRWKNVGCETSQNTTTSPLSTSEAAHKAAQCFWGRFEAKSRPATCPSVDLSEFFWKEEKFWWLWCWNFLALLRSLVTSWNLILFKCCAGFLFNEILIKLGLTDPAEITHSSVVSLNNPTWIT